MTRRNTIGAVSLAALTAALLTATAPAFAAGSEAPLPPKTDANGAGNMYGSTHVQNPMNSSADTGTSSTQQPQSAAAPSPAEEVALSKVENPQTALASATVQDSSGQTVGTAQKINTGKSGKTVSVEVALNTASGKTATIKASQLRYDQASNTLKAKLNQSQIDALSSGAPSSPQP